MSYHNNGGQTPYEWGVQAVGLPQARSEGGWAFSVLCEGVAEAKARRCHNTFHFTFRWRRRSDAIKKSWFDTRMLLRRSILEGTTGMYFKGAVHRVWQCEDGRSRIMRKLLFICASMRIFINNDDGDVTSILQDQRGSSRNKPGRDQAKRAHSSKENDKGELNRWWQGTATDNGQAAIMYMTKLKKSWAGRTKRTKEGLRRNSRRAAGRHNNGCNRQQMSYNVISADGNREEI